VCFSGKEAEGGGRGHKDSGGGNVRLSLTPSGELIAVKLGTSFRNWGPASDSLGHTLRFREAKVPL
jgi:hypothetical protein